MLVDNFQSISVISVTSWYGLLWVTSPSSSSITLVSAVPSVNTGLYLLPTSNALRISTTPSPRWCSIYLLISAWSLSQFVCSLLSVSHGAASPFSWSSSQWLALLSSLQSSTSKFSLKINSLCLSNRLLRVYNFLSPMTTTYQLWYIRESSVAIWVGNVICCWQITQKLWHTRSFDNHHAHIVKQPEIQNPEFSEGGSPKDDEWWKAWGKKCREIGDMISRATTTAPRTNVTRNDLESAVTGIEEAKEPM